MAFTCPPRSQLTVSSCQQPWPRSLAHCCFRKCIFKPPWLWDQPGNVPARGSSSQKAVWNYAPLCHMQRNTVATPQWSALSSHHLFPTVSKYKVFCSEEMAQALVLLHAGWSHSIRMICLGCYSSGAITERWWQNFEQGVFFLISFCRLPEQATLCTASLYWSKTMLYLFI